MCQQGSGSTSLNVFGFAQGVPKQRSSATMLSLAVIVILGLKVKVKERQWDQENASVKWRNCSKRYSKCGVDES